MISFSDVSIPSSMAPLDCMEDMRLIEMGSGTLETTLAERWSAVPGVEMVSAAFWPSLELLRVLAGLDGDSSSRMETAARWRREGTVPAG